MGLQNGNERNANDSNDGNDNDSNLEFDLAPFVNPNVQAAIDAVLKKLGTIRGNNYGKTKELIEPNIRIVEPGAAGTIKDCLQRAASTQGGDPYSLHATFYFAMQNLGTLKFSLDPKTRIFAMIVPVKNYR